MTEGHRPNMSRFATGCRRCQGSVWRRFDPGPGERALPAVRSREAAKYTSRFPIRPSSPRFDALPVAPVGTGKPLGWSQGRGRAI